MTITDLRPPRPSGAPATTLSPATRGPFVRIVAGSLTFGALAAAVLTLGVAPGAVEHVTTGLALLAFAAGFALLAALSTRMTDQPQGWAYVPAAFLTVAGMALLVVAPGDEGLTTAAWGWPPAMLAVAAWSVRQMRASMPGRPRWLVYPILGVLTVASIGAVMNNIAVQRDGSTASMPGALFDVGGHRLHLSCSGTGSPTVVVENGLGGNSALWSRVTAGTAGTTRICAYDRAGQGWSEDAPAPQDSVAVARELHRLLEVAGEQGPYVLTGHSTGGVYAMTYAARYPDQVAGMVLLDSASPHQFTVLPDYDATFAMLTRIYGIAPTLARLGLGRAVPVLNANDLPGLAGEQAAAFTSSPRDARTARDEVSTYRRSFTQAQDLTTLGRKPLVVVTASDTATDTTGWSDAQRQLADLSSNASLRTVDSSHGGVLDHPTASAASIEAIHDVVRAVRTAKPLGTS